MIQQSKTAKNFRNFVIGIDEAGRGPLAGPVVVAGVKIKSKILTRPSRQALGKNQNAKFWEDFKVIKDSKKLTPQKRDKWFAILTRHPQINWAVVSISPKVIDRVNIAVASNLGADRVCNKLNNVTSRLRSKNNNIVRVCREYILLDGGLKLPIHIPHKTIIKGDEKIPVIAAASIIAKVTRDRLMLNLHKKYPQYRFDLHKGYGTKLHQDLIKKFGRSEVHRKSFRV